MAIIEKPCYKKKISTKTLSLGNNILNTEIKNSSKYPIKIVTKLDLKKLNQRVDTPANENKLKAVSGTESPINKIIDHISPKNSLNKLFQRDFNKFTTICKSPISFENKDTIRFEKFQNPKGILKSERNIHESNEKKFDSEFKLKFKLSEGNYFGDIALIKDGLS